MRNVVWIRKALQKYCEMAKKKVFFEKKALFLGKEKQRKLWEQL